MWHGVCFYRGQKSYPRHQETFKKIASRLGQIFFK